MGRQPPVSGAFSWQLRQMVNDWDFYIDLENAEFVDCGLKRTMIVRLSFLAAVPAKAISGTIGAVPQKTMEIIRNQLGSYIIG